MTLLKYSLLPAALDPNAPKYPVDNEGQSIYSQPQLYQTTSAIQIDGSTAESVSQTVHLVQTARLLKQMSDLSAFSYEVFQGLNEKTEQVFGKINEMQQRLTHIKELLPLVRQRMVDCHIPSGIGTERSDWRAQQPIAQLLTKETADPSIMRLYQDCAPLPRLDLLDKFRDDGHSSLMYYSYPQFFMERWRELMEKETSTKKKKRMTKLKKKSTMGTSKSSNLDGRVSGLPASSHLKQVPEEVPIFSGAIEKQSQEVTHISKSLQDESSSIPRRISSLSQTARSVSTQMKSLKKTDSNLSEMTNALDALIDDFNNADPELSNDMNIHNEQGSALPGYNETAASSAVETTITSVHSHTSSVNTSTTIQSIQKSQSIKSLKPYSIPAPPPPPPSGPLPKPPVDENTTSARSIPPPPPMPTSAVPSPPPPVPSLTSAAVKRVSMGPLKIPVNPVLRKTSGPQKIKPESSLSDITSNVLSAAASKLKKPVELAPLQNNVPKDTRSQLLDSIRGRSFNLRKTEYPEKSNAEKKGPANDVATILMRRIAIEESDSDSSSGEDGEGADTEWS